MLTAAVAGPVFTSPSVDTILAALRTVASPAGVLLIVKSYTGDRLNFGMAAEQLRLEGIPVETVIVADDVALAGSGEHAGRRGIAGTVLVHKIAGAAAELGAPLDEVANIARRVAAEIRTMGVSLDSCTVPGSDAPSRGLGENEIEWGLGIHGEAGVERGGLVSADAVVDRLLDQVVADMTQDSPGRVVLLVNNLGATPPVELEIITGSALSWLEDRGHTVERVWTGAFLTALDTPGVSLTLLAVDDAILGHLDAGTTAPAWPGASGHVSPTSVLDVPTDDDADGPALEKGGTLYRAISGVCEALIKAEPELTELDSLAGDGDLGTSMERGAQAVLDRIETIPRVPEAALQAISLTIRRAVGGTSGPLYAVGLLHAATVLTDSPTPDDWAAAFKAGIAQVGELGGARQGDATMLDALIPAAEAFAESEGDPSARLDAAVAAAADGAKDTIDSVARLGRASYLGERSSGLMDPGARAVVIWLSALRDSIRGSR